MATMARTGARPETVAFSSSLACMAGPQTFELSLLPFQDHYQGSEVDQPALVVIALQANPLPASTGIPVGLGSSFMSQLLQFGSSSLLVT